MLSMDPQERELDALIGLYLLRCEAEGKSPETQRAYRESLQRFCPWDGKTSCGPPILMMQTS